MKNYKIHFLNKWTSKLFIHHSSAIIKENFNLIHCPNSTKQQRKYDLSKITFTNKKTWFDSYRLIREDEVKLHMPKFSSIKRNFCSTFSTKWAHINFLRCIKQLTEIQQNFENDDKCFSETWYDAKEIKGKNSEDEKVHLSTFPKNLVLRM